MNVSYMSIPGIKHDSVEERMNIICKIICNYLSIPRDELFLMVKIERIAYARHLCCFLIRNHINIKLKDMAAYMSGRHHTTIINGYNTRISFASPNERLLIALKISPKRINCLRPNLSASAPPAMLPIKPKREDMPNSMPA